jgi:cobalt/nickel transport system ATP-binding protein
MNDCLVRFSGVSFSYGPDRPVLDEADFELRPGQRIGLVGSNGSGKTTLLHLVVGLLRPSAGEINAFGRPRRAEADFLEVRRRAGLLFQDSEDQLFCPTVSEDVAFGPLNLGKSHHEAIAIVGRTLAMLGLEQYEHRITHKLSGGEKRLVALATVLAMQPEVLLLDEPVSGLDEEVQERLLKILADLPLAMIVVSHERDFLRQTTNKTLRLGRGKLEAV